MIEAIFIVLVFGAVIAAIWGRETAQGCFSKLWQGLCWIFGIVMLVVAPAVMVPVMIIIAFVYMIIWARNKGKENQEAADKAKLIGNLKAVQTSLAQSMIPVGQQRLEAALVNATSKPQRFIPRSRATSVMPGATPASEFWATHVRDQKGSRYVIVEKRTNQFIILSTNEFLKDWVPWLPPAAPQAQASAKPNWRSINQ